MAQETGKQRKESEHRTIDELLTKSQIRLTRTINSDAVLAEQLLHELKRRQVDLKPCADRRCNPKVALISEWDTLYGRALPRTFAAVVMNKGSGETGPDLEAEIDKLRRDEWPSWIYRHSYLAGLDGELPASGGDKSADKDKDSSPNKASALLGSQPHSAERNAAQRPEGRGQLDYVVRLAAALKQEETRNGEEFEGHWCAGKRCLRQAPYSAGAASQLSAGGLFHYRPERQTELSFGVAVDTQSHHRVTFRT